MKTLLNLDIPLHNSNRLNTYTIQDDNSLKVFISSPEVGDCVVVSFTLLDDSKLKIHIDVLEEMTDAV